VFYPRQQSRSNLFFIKRSTETQAHSGGLRSSDKGFLNLSWPDYWQLLRWTARQRAEGLKEKVPRSLSKVLAEIGIDVSMWRDLVWNW